MAALIDRIRENTHSRRDVLKLIDARISRAHSDVAAAKARTAEILTSRQALRPAIDGRRRSVSTIEQEAAQLERQLADLRQRLVAAQEEVQREVQKAAKLTKDFQDAESAVETATKRLAELAAEKQEAQKAVLAACRRSLTEFLVDQEARLQGITSKSLEQKAKVQALEKLRSSRHESAEVASLCEAREEWLRVLREARVPLVQKSARDELAKVEAELNRLFPGALEVEAGAALEEIEELYYLRKGTSVLVYLPIGMATWQAMEGGKTDGHSEIAARLGWSLRKSLRVDWDSAQFLNNDALGVVYLQADSGEDIADQHVDLSLEGKDNVAFIMSTLPPEITEALSNEN